MSYKKKKKQIEDRVFTAFSYRDNIRDAVIEKKIKWMQSFITNNIDLQYLFVAQN